MSDLTPFGDSPAIHGDVIEVMAQLPDACVDAIVTDPPYGLEFMGKEWDKFKQGRAADYQPPSIQNVDIPGTGFTHLPQLQKRVNPRCAKCGHYRWSGTPCKCEEPDWIADKSFEQSYQSWTTAWATEAYRIIKPGAYMLVMGGTRTHHRLACGLEDAGFEIRDELAWIFASGFPKNYDVSKGIDKRRGCDVSGYIKKSGKSDREIAEYCGVSSALVRFWRRNERQIMYPEWRKLKELFGIENKQFDHNLEEIERQVIGKTGRCIGPSQIDNLYGFGSAQEPEKSNLLTKPATPEAQYWEGYGTALKPAHEPIWLCKKPNEGTYVDNVLKHGCGAMNIDGTRIGYESRKTWYAGSKTYLMEVEPDEWKEKQYMVSGRWPANVIVDCYPEEFIGGVAIEGEAQHWKREYSHSTRGMRNFGGGEDQREERGKYLPENGLGNGLLGPYTRFFVIPKPSKKEKTAGGKVENKHVTVKPARLGMWLIKLIAPHQHPVIVLDPFCGSGSFLVSALRLNQEEGYQIDYYGIDKDKDSVKTTLERLKAEKTSQMKLF